MSGPASASESKAAAPAARAKGVIDIVGEDALSAVRCPGCAPAHTRAPPPPGAPIAGAPAARREANSPLPAITRHDKPWVLIMFTASWCVPCKRLYPAMEALGSDDAWAERGVAFYKLDVDTLDASVDDLEIGTLPTFVIFDTSTGDVMGRTQGAAHKRPGRRVLQLLQRVVIDGERGVDTSAEAAKAEGRGVGARPGGDDSGAGSEASSARDGGKAARSANAFDALDDASSSDSEGEPRGK